MKFLVFYGSVRSARQGIKAARFVVNQIKQRGHEVVLIDPVEYNFPLLDKRFFEHEEAGTTPEFMKNIAELIRTANGFVVVAGEYNHGVPPALKNMLDHYQADDYNRRPAAIVSYSAGPFGGVRSVSHILDTLSSLGMVVSPKTLPISKVQDSFDENGLALDEAYERRIQGFLDEFEWYSQKLSA